MTRYISAFAAIMFILGGIVGAEATRFWSPAAIVVRVAPPSLPWEYQAGDTDEKVSVDWEDAAVDIPCPVPVGGCAVTILPDGYRYVTGDGISRFEISTSSGCRCIDDDCMEVECRGPLP